MEIGRNNFDFRRLNTIFVWKLHFFFFTPVTAQLTFFPFFASIDWTMLNVNEIVREFFYWYYVCFPSKYTRRYALYLCVYYGHTSIRTAEATIQVICAWMDGWWLCLCVPLCQSIHGSLFIVYANVLYDIWMLKWFVIRVASFVKIVLLAAFDYMCGWTDVSKRCMTVYFAPIPLSSILTVRNVHIVVW